MKKFITILLIIILSFSLFGCTNNQAEPVPTAPGEIVVLPTEAIIVTPEPTETTMPTPIVTPTTAPEINDTFEELAAKLVEDYANQSDFVFDIDSINKTVNIIYNLDDGEMQNFQVGDEPLEEYLPNMVGSELINRIKNMDATELNICLRNNDKIFIAYDVFSNTIRTDLMDLAVG